MILNKQAKLEYDKVLETAKGESVIEKFAIAILMIIRIIQVGLIEYVGGDTFIKEVIM